MTIGISRVLKNTEIDLIKFTLPAPHKSDRYVWLHGIVSYFLYVLLKVFSLATNVLLSFKESVCLEFNTRLLVQNDYNSHPSEMYYIFRKVYILM